MKINYFKDIPKGYEYYEPQELDEYDIANLVKLGIDEIWYWYGSGCYEGSGQLLMRKGDKYDIHDMGHCSCYGPIDNVSFIPYDLDVLKERCQNIKIETEALFNAIN